MDSVIEMKDKEGKVHNVRASSIENVVSNGTGSFLVHRDGERFIYLVNEEEYKRVLQEWRIAAKGL